MFSYTFLIGMLIGINVWLGSNVNLGAAAFIAVLALYTVITNK